MGAVVSLEVEHRIRDSAADFRRAVWPRLRPYVGGGDLVPVETVTDSEFARLLDTLGMTDAWQVCDPHGIRAIASRVQWGSRVWASWTIRRSLRSGRPTEWHRLMQEGDWQLPQLIVQAYLDRPGGTLLAASAIWTSGLQRMLREGWHGLARLNPADDSTFYPVWWAEAARRGVEYIDLTSEQNGQ